MFAFEKKVFVHLSVTCCVGDEESVDAGLLLGSDKAEPTSAKIPKHDCPSS